MHSWQPLRHSGNGLRPYSSAGYAAPPSQNKPACYASFSIVGEAIIHLLLWLNVSAFPRRLTPRNAVAVAGPRAFAGLLAPSGAWVFYQGFPFHQQ